ncbi:MAG: hypothetical protein KDD44_08665 [Bdellovibrionales bacterium]|nr:hypothetical protein [Bdellovibrionales bacterium]
MVYLLLHIVGSSATMLLLRYLGHRGLPVAYAIAVNYLVCVVVGSAASGWPLLHVDFWRSPWIPFALAQGALLIGIFFIIDRCAAQIGIGLSSLIARLSVVIPTAAAFVLYGDSITSAKIAGVGLVVCALVLCSRQRAVSSGAFTALPVLLLVAYGGHSTLYKWVQETYLEPENYAGYVLTSFFFAAILGVSYASLLYAKQVHQLTPHVLIMGLVIGFTNFLSVYFLLLALGLSGLESSIVFPVLAVSVVVISTLGGYVLFGERLDRQQRFGMVIGLLSIVVLLQ